jgi:putative ABC transport system substrate-binding protein
MAFARQTRRRFIGAAAATLALPSIGWAQQSGRRHICVLLSGNESDPEMQSHLAAFRQRLESTGWLEGRNLHVDYRFADGNSDRYAPLAKELIALHPDAILVRGTPGTTALLHESQTIPMVFVGLSDPIGSGLVKSLAHPGGNVTGFLLYEEDIVGKWLSLLKEISPGVTRAGLMANPALMPFDYFLRSARTAAAALGIEIESRPITDTASIERAIDSLARPNTGLVVLPQATEPMQRDLIIGRVAHHKLPTIYPFRFFVAAGGFISYETDVTDHYRQSADYVDRILRGDKPADLPVQVPTKYVTTLNLKTAKALGLEVPPSLLLRADEVIE